MQTIVIGRVLRVRRRSGGGWRVRLVDTGGALAAAEIVPANPLPPPAVGRWIALHGRFLPAPDWDSCSRWSCRPRRRDVIVTLFCTSVTLGIAHATSPTSRLMR